MDRRKLMLLLAGAMTAAPPLRAQQKAMPVIGFLGSTSPGPYSAHMAAFHQGLGEAGYVEGQNVTIEYRWAEGHYDRLAALAADLWDARSISSQQAAPLRREPRKTRPHDVRHGTDLARRGHRTEEGEAPCQRWREARGLGRKGLPVDSNLCRRSRERQVEQCPSFENCESVRTSQSR